MGEVHQTATFTKTFRIDGGDFKNAGKVSKQIKKILKQLNIDEETIWRTMIVAYEAEMNVVLYAYHCDVSLEINPDMIKMRFTDEGPGIEDIPLAMTEGYSTATREMRERGFGAGLGLPNIKKTSDTFDIDSILGDGTILEMTIFLPKTI